MTGVQTCALPISKIADGSVTGVKISLGSDALGDIMYHDVAQWTRLPIGTQDEVLRVGSTGQPEWGTPESTPLITFLTGTVMWTSQATIDDSFGLALNGQTVVNGVVDYPELAAKIMSGDLVGVATVAGADIVLADWNEVGVAQGGYFQRGLGNRTAGAFVNDSTALPNSGWSFSGTAASAGAHTHSFGVKNAAGINETPPASGAGSVTGSQTTSSDGAHTHSLSGSVSGGDAETAPKAVSGLWYVFAEKL